MFNIRWGVLAGVAALVLSLALGIISSAGFSHAIIRALVFGAVFFTFGAGSWFLINTFLPELLALDEVDSGLEPSDDPFSAPSPGSRVNITLGDTSGAALPESNRGLPDPSDVGNIADLISGAVDPAAGAKTVRDGGAGQGMDQKAEDGYTYNREKNSSGGDGVADTSDSSVFSMDFGGFVPSGDSGVEESAAPDLESVTGTFSVDLEDIPSKPAEMFEPERRSAGSKPQKFDGDFDPKEIAAGIRTVLQKDK
ncbi:MAG: hypothetical protein LBD18_03035 [Treponema sp.]|nr:hypothetical protein [Treponema sp.]